MKDEGIEIQQSVHTHRKIPKDFQGILDYNKLVRVRQRLKYYMEDILRLISFKKEAIENAIFAQEIIDS
jgi:hypothetical protein